MPATKKQLCDFLHQLKAILPKYAPDFQEPTIKAWSDALHTLEYKQLAEVYLYCRDNLDQFPSIKQIKEMVVDEKDDLPRDPLQELIKAVQSRNFKRHPTILDLASRLGGFEVIGDWNPEHYDHKRRMIEPIWADIKAQWKFKQINHKEDFKQMPPANVMRVIEAGAKEAAETNPARKTPSILGWIDEIRQHGHASFKN